MGKCNIGELVISYKGSINPDLNRAIANTIALFGYEIDFTNYDDDCHICYMTFKKECGCFPKKPHGNEKK